MNFTNILIALVAIILIIAVIHSIWSKRQNKAKKFDESKMELFLENEYADNFKNESDMKLDDDEDITMEIPDVSEALVPNDEDNIDNKEKNSIKISLRDNQVFDLKVDEFCEPVVDESPVQAQNPNSMNPQNLSTTENPNEKPLYTYTEEASNSPTTEKSVAPSSLAKTYSTSAQNKNLFDSNPMDLNQPTQDIKQTSSASTQVNSNNSASSPQLLNPSKVENSATNSSGKSANLFDQMMISDSKESPTSRANVAPSTPIAPTQALQSKEASSESAKTTENKENTEASEASENTPNEQVIMLYLVAPENQDLLGNDLAQALDKEGFILGDKQIYHRHSEFNNMQSPVLFSLANLENNGVFDLQHMSELRTFGVAMFMEVPVKYGSNATNLRLMLNCARALAKELNGVLLTDQQQPFDSTTERYYLTKLL